VQTPRFGHDGTTVEIRGTGFCTSGLQTTLLKVGGYNTPFVVGQNGRLITFKTPPYATSTPVQVGDLLDGFKDTAPLVVDHFRDREGFPFQNSTQFKDGLGDYDLGDMFEVFHANPVDPFTWGYMAFIDQLMQADCFGFSVTAGRLHENPARIPTFAGWDGTNPAVQTARPLDAWHLFSPALSAGGTHDVPIAKVIRRGQALLASSEVLTGLLAQSNLSGDKQNFHDSVLRNMAGDKPAIIGIMSHCMHAVLAYGLRDKPGGAFTVDLYNPNVPFMVGDSVTASLIQNSIEVAADGSYNFNDGNLACSGSLSDVRVLGVDSVPIVGTMVGLDTQMLIVHLNGAADVTQVEDDAGHTLLRADGTENTDPATRLPSAARLSGFTGRSNTPLFVVRGGARHKITVRGKANGTYTFNHFGPGFGAVMQNVPVNAGGVDTILVDPRAASFELRSGAQKNIAAKLLVRAPQGTKVATLKTTVAPGGSSLVKFDGARDTFLYQHTGATAKVGFDLSFQTGQTPAVNTQTAESTLATGESLQVSPMWPTLAAGGKLLHRDAAGKETARPLK
jgi:hypothetical protein